MEHDGSVSQSEECASDNSSDLDRYISHSHCIPLSSMLVPYSYLLFRFSNWSLPFRLIINILHADGTLLILATCPAQSS
jgi:hypothetical protein